jgi:hypothetical protein
MKASHLQTPRTLNECHWTPGYTTGTTEPRWERVAGYLLAIAIGCALASALVIGWSA